MSADLQVCTLMQGLGLSVKRSQQQAKQASSISFQKLALQILEAAGAGAWHIVGMYCWD